MRRRAISIVLIISILLSGFLLKHNMNIAHADFVQQEKFLIVGYFEYWVDGVYKYDDAKGRHSVADITKLIYDFNIFVPKVEGYKIKDVEVYDPNKHYDNVKINRWTTVNDNEIRIYSVQGLKLLNVNELKGVDADGTQTVSTQFTPLAPKDSIQERVGNITKYKSYMPFLYTFEKVSKSKLVVNFLDEATKKPIKDREVINLNFNQINNYYIPEIPNYSFSYWILNNGARRNENPVKVQGIEGEQVLDIYYKNNSDIANAYVLCWGTGEPNPAVLEGGKATVSVEVNGEVFNLKETVSSWTLSIQLPTGEKREEVINTSSTNADFTFSDIIIDKDTVFPITATVKTTTGKTLTASNIVKILVIPPEEEEYTITPHLWTDPYPGIINITKYQFENNIPIQFNMDLDASRSEASLGIDSYQFSWWIKKDRVTYAEWEGDWVKKDVLELKGLTLYPAAANEKNEIIIDGCVAVKDKKGHIRYARDDGKIKLNVVTAPPETELTVPLRNYPKEVTNYISELKNIATYSYFSEDEAEYSYSIESLYKWNGTEWSAVFENQIAYDREIEITGDAEDIFKLVVKVVDEYGTESKPDTKLIYIETAKPDIDVSVDLIKLQDNILTLQVDNLTHPEIEKLYPTSYTNWEIKDAEGTTLASGAGKLPNEVLMDNRYIGTVVIAKQYAKNTLGNTAEDKDFYGSNANLEIDVVPNRLFETEYATIYNYARGLKYQNWGIKLNHEPEYKEFIFEDDRFTREKGLYNVMSEGGGVTVLRKDAPRYSNDISDLIYELPAFTQQEIKSLFGADYFYAEDSQYWRPGINNIEEGSFSYNGKNYRFKRPSYLYVYRNSEFMRVKDVEFINGRPAAYFDVTGTLKAYKKVTVDGSKSLDYTDEELQGYYPLDFEHEKTRYIIEPLKGLEGEVDYSQNDFIKGEGREIIDGKVTFPGKKIQDLRFDKGGVYRITYITYNGLLESEPYSREVVISPELEPTVDISVSPPIAYRDPNNNLKAFLHVLVLYNSPDDRIDLDRSFLTIKYDANNDGDFSNDVGHQGTVKKDEDNLMDYASITNKIFQEDRAVISIAIDNPDKNLFGKYHFEFTAYEDPETPYFILEGETFDLSVDTSNIDDSKKQIFVDNTQPIINILMSRKNKSELTIIETSVTTPVTTEDIEYILYYFETLKIQIDIKYIDIEGKEHNFKNY